jgi:hypothetical protein
MRVLRHACMPTSWRKSTLAAGALPLDGIAAAAEYKPAVQLPLS